MGLKAMKQITLIAAIAWIAVGCSKKNITTPPPVYGTPGIVDPNNPGTGGSGTIPTSGASVDLNVVSHAVLESYAGRYINTPSNIQLHLDVFDVAQGSTASTQQFGGSLKISYVENGMTIVGSFSSGTSIHDTRYNKWATTGGKQKLKLMFQDNLGALTVILEPLNDLDLWKGEVYFRNFDFSVCGNPPFYGSPVCNQQSSLKCWNISAGPYDCRAYLSGNDMRPDIINLPGYGSSYKHNGTTYPRVGYQKLGTFSGIDLSRALNE